MGSPLGLRARLATLVICVVAAIAASAAAQVPIPGSMSVGHVLSLLSRAGVRLGPEAFLAASEAYVDGFEEALAKAIKEGGPPYLLFAGGMGTIPSVAELKHLHELEARVFAAENGLRQRFFDAIAEAASPEDRTIIESLRTRIALIQAEQRMQGDLSVSHYRCPDDLGAWLLARLDQSASEEAFRHAALIAATNGDARFAALVAARAGILARQLAIAKDAEARRAGGNPPEPGEGDRLVHDVGDFTPGGADGTRLLAVQLDMYRQVRHDLTESEAAAIRTFWVPRMLGITSAPRFLPRLPVGSHQIAPFVTEFNRCNGLDDASRERVREIGRAWIKDDDAIIDQAMDRLVSGGKLLDVTSDREARARKACDALAAIKGLEWLADPLPEWPPDPLPVVDADAKEFGQSLLTLGRPKPGDGEEESLAPGLPVGYSRRNELAFADLLQLDETQRVVLATVLVDARERWSKEVQPLIAEAAPEDTRLAMGKMTAAILDARKARIEARVKAWEAATALDEATFSALEAAFGEAFDVRALQLVQASRSAARASPPANRSETVGIRDIASRILDTPVSPAGRRAAIAAAAPHLAAWVAAVVEADAERTRAMLENIEAQRPILDMQPTGERVRIHRDSEEYRRLDASATALRGACNELAAGIEAAVLATVEGEDARRYRLSFASLRQPAVYYDLRPLWGAVDRAMACVAAEQRAAAEANVRPLLEAIEARVDRLGTIGSGLPPSGEWSDDDPLRDARMQLRWTAGLAVSLTAARIGGALPAACWSDLPATEKLDAWRRWLDRLAAPAPAVPAS